MSNKDESLDHPLAKIAIYVVMIVHTWAIVVAFKVSGFVMALITLCLPFLAECGWGFWAYKHDHPFLWGAIAFFVLPFAVMPFLNAAKRAKGTSRPDTSE